jgi:hypothetical protein
MGENSQYTNGLIKTGLRLRPQAGETLLQEERQFLNVIIGTIQQEPCLSEPVLDLEHEGRDNAESLHGLEVIKQATTLYIHEIGRAHV